MSNEERGPDTQELQRLLRLWKGVDGFDDSDQNAKDAIAEGLAAWGSGKRELEDGIIYDGIDFTASYFYETNGKRVDVRPFLQRAARANLSKHIECAARGYLLTLYGDISQALCLSKHVLDDDSDTPEAISALHKAVILQIPGLDQALRPLFLSPRLDPATRDMIDPDGLIQTNP